MEDYTWLLLTVASYVAAGIYDLKRRDKDSEFSPKKFRWGFYLKDNAARIILSLVFSCLLAWIFFTVSPQLAIMNEELSLWGLLVYILIGAAPDLVISYAKRKTNFLRPNVVDGFERMSDTVDPTKKDKIKS